MVIDNAYLDQVINEVEGLFDQKQSYNPVPAQTIPAASNNLINSPGSYIAPIHGDWRSSGGFTYQPNPTHPTGHMGVDMRVQAGTPVYPLAPGLVVNVGTDPKGGNVINIAHDGNVKTYYAHLSTVEVQKGDKVNTNTVIGTVGNTGNASHTFPHLHFQVWKDGQIQDPAKFFSVPQYTNLSAEERQRGPWLSEQAKQQAEVFNMQNHLANRRMAFSREVDKLVKLADQYCELIKRSL
jgi:murein DD-endopeptidase MepM/ murein hydrolase activator NlpD